MVLSCPISGQYGTCSDMTSQDHAKYLEAYNRGVNDMKRDMPYRIGQEQSNLEKQAYCDGWMSVG
jgi:hypothetical protein